MMLRYVLPAILAAAFVLVTDPAQADLKKGWIDYTHGAKKLKGYLLHDEPVSRKRPAVMMLHARSGMSDQTLKLAEVWARLGYVTFVADIFGYGEGVLPKSTDEMDAQTRIFRSDRPLARARTQAAWDAIVRHPLVDPSRTAAIGYCFGGDMAVEFGATGAPLALNVVIHGSLEKKYAEGWARNIKGRVLILHGAEDVGYPLTTVASVVDDLRAAKVPFQLEVYSGATHGFSAPQTKHDERANEQSIAATARGLREVFGL